MLLSTKLEVPFESKAKLVVGNNVGSRLIINVSDPRSFFLSSSANRHGLIYTEIIKIQFL